MPCGWAVATTPVGVGGDVVSTNVNRSALVAALVPPTVVTVTSTACGDSAGVVAVIFVELTTVNDWAATVPKDTAVALVRRDPVIVTVVPPFGVPDAGEIAETAGGATAVNWSAVVAALAPPGPVTCTSTVPAASAGVTAVMLESDCTLKLAAPMVPNVTALAPVNPEPEIAMVLPPTVEPCIGLMPEIAGAATNEYRSAAVVALVPLGVVTVTSTAPAECAGTVAVNVVPEATLKFVAGVEPKATAETLVKPEPVSVTVFPPDTGPLDGETD